MRVTTPWFAAFALAWGGLAAAQTLDSAYHNSDEILTELTAYAAAYPEWMTLDSIGHSAEFGRPIWMAKLSDNPDRIEPEAAILLVGQVHAEEVVGIEIVLEVMRQMLDRNEENAFRQRLEGLELYIIPTANPEGLDIVHSGLDISFRKNCRDNLGDGQLKIFDGEGWDTSGVDLNRNFGLHWDRGDTLFRPEETFCYNGYRGSAPFSEPESQALRDLALERPFLYSMVYHGSRTGTNTESLIAPWFWRENNIIKRPPDYEAINGLGEKLAGMMPKQDNPDEHYRPAQSMQRKGQLQDWYYVETGTIQYMAEVASDIQPDSTGMGQVVRDNLPAVWYLLDLALGLEGLDGFGTLTVIARDAETGEPLDATISMANPDIPIIDHPILAPRKTNRYNGRYDWLLPAGERRITLKKLGYRTNVYDGFEILDGERSVLEAGLEPLDLLAVTFRTRDETTGSLTPSRLLLKDSDGNLVFDFDLADGIITVDLPLHQYQAILTSSDYVPQAFPLELSEDAQLEFTLQRGGAAYIEDFDQNREWDTGDGPLWGVVTFDGRTALTESPNGDYLTGTTYDLWLNDVVRLDSTHRATLQMIHRPYFEPLDDYGQVICGTTLGSMISVWFSQLSNGWDTLYIPLDSLAPGMLDIHFRVVSDAAICEDGWLIDRVAVLHTGFASAVPPSALRPFPFAFSLSAFPNPFNSSTTIRFALPKAGPVRLEVYDPLGRLVRELTPKGWMEAGEHRINWDASAAASGVYMLRIEAAQYHGSIPVSLIK